MDPAIGLVIFGMVFVGISVLMFVSVLIHGIVVTLREFVRYLRP